MAATSYETEAALHLLGKMAWISGRTTHAIVHWMRLLERSPGSIANNDYGLLMWDLGHVSAGERHVLISLNGTIEALAASPERASSLGNVCCMYFLRFQDYAGALPYCLEV